MRSKRLEQAGALGQAAFEQGGHDQVEMAMAPEGCGDQPVGEGPVALIGQMRGIDRLEALAPQNVGERFGRRACELARPASCP